MSENWGESFFDQLRSIEQADTSIKEMKMKDKVSLYAYNETHSYGELFFFFTATNEQLERIWEREVSWHDELGKHSEGTYCFDSGTVEIVDVSEEIGRELTAHRLIPYWDIEDIIERVEERY